MSEVKSKQDVREELFEIESRLQAIRQAQQILKELEPGTKRCKFTDFHGHVGPQKYPMADTDGDLVLRYEGEEVCNCEEGEAVQVRILPSGSWADVLRVLRKIVDLIDHQSQLEAIGPLPQPTTNEEWKKAFGDAMADSHISDRTEVYCGFAGDTSRPLLDVLMSQSPENRQRALAMFRELKAERHSTPEGIGEWC